MSKPWQYIKTRLTGNAKQRAPAHFITYSLGDNDDPEHDDDIDLVALKTTPAEFHSADCDVTAYEINNLSSRYTADEIASVKELRQRQLDAQISQLVHHVSANTDNLTAGIQTCRTIGDLLKVAKGSSSTARTRLASAVRDAGAALQVASLHQRTKNLRAMCDLLEKVLYVRQRCIEVESLVHHALTADIAGGFEVAAVRHANGELETLEARLRRPDVAPLRCSAPLRARASRMRDSLANLTQRLVQTVVESFEESLFAELLTLHVLNMKTGADLTKDIQEHLEKLVLDSTQASKDSSVLGTSIFNAFLRQDSVMHAPSGDLTAIIKCIRPHDFLPATEHVMQLQLEWLCSYHSMQLYVQQELAHVSSALEALEGGAAVRLDERLGTPSWDTGDDESNERVVVPLEAAAAVAAAASKSASATTAELDDAVPPAAETLAEPSAACTAADLAVPALPREPEESAQLMTSSDEAQSARTNGAQTMRPVAGSGSDLRGATVVENGAAAVVLASPSGASFPGMPVTEFLKQRERILGEIQARLDDYRDRFGQQAARNVNRLYQDRKHVQSQDYKWLLKHGIKFATIIAAFRADRPGNVEGDWSEGKSRAVLGEQLLDTIKLVCSRDWFPDLAKQHRQSLHQDFLPSEMCVPMSPGPDSARMTLRAGICKSDAKLKRTEAALMSARFDSWATESFTRAARRKHKKLKVGISDGDATGARGGGSSAASMSTTAPASVASGGTPAAPASEEGASASDLSTDPTHTVSSSGGAGGGPDNNDAMDPLDVPETVPEATPIEFSSKTVLLNATMHIHRCWYMYGRLLPVFVGTSEGTLNVVRATKALFDEFMLWTAINFAGITEEDVVSGMNGVHDRFFRVIRRLMVQRDQRNRNSHHTQRLRECEGALERSASVAGTLRARQESLGPGREGSVALNGSHKEPGLDSLVRGTIVCDALRTLADELLDAKDILHKRFYDEGDNAMLRVLCEIYEKGNGRLFHRVGSPEPDRVLGSVHEVEELRKRCVEGAVKANLGRLRSKLMPKFNLHTTYDVRELADSAEQEWIRTLQAELSRFTGNLAASTATMNLRGASLSEIWTNAVGYVDHLVLEGLSTCVVSSGKMAALFGRMANVGKNKEQKSMVRKGLSHAGKAQLNADVNRLKRVVTDAAPDALQPFDASSIMRVSVWVEALNLELKDAGRTKDEHRNMIEAWESWAGRAAGGSLEGKTQCRNLFTALQKLNNVGSDVQWVANFTNEMLG